MIKLTLPGYCKYCEDFEPIVTQRPERLLTDCGETFSYGDTIVECRYKRRCESIYNHLKKAKNNESI